MKYDPKKLTYGDALRISTANMTVTVEVGGVQHVTGKLKHIDMDDALACDDPALRDLMALSLIITDNEYFVVRDDDGGILCPAIRFDHDLNVTWNTIISIEENPDDGVELDFADWKATLVKVETPPPTRTSQPPTPQPRSGRSSFPRPTDSTRPRPAAYGSTRATLGRPSWTITATFRRTPCSRPPRHSPSAAAIRNDSRSNASAKRNCQPVLASTATRTRRACTTSTVTACGSSSPTCAPISTCS